MILLYTPLNRWNNNCVASKIYTCKKMANKMYVNLNLSIRNDLVNLPISHF